MTSLVITKAAAACLRVWSFGDRKQASSPQNSFLFHQPMAEEKEEKSLSESVNEAMYVNFIKSTAALPLLPSEIRILLCSNIQFLGLGK